MDRLTELFASKPTSYLGLGVVYNGDTRGNGVTSTEQGVEVIPRFNQSDGGGGVFKGAWFPTAVDSTHINLTAGSISDGLTTRTPDVTDIAVHASNLQYIYLKCTLSPTTVDSIVTGGTITAAVIEASGSTQTNNNTTGYVLLCTWQAGSLLDRYSYWSMQAELLNSGEGDTVFRTWVAS